VTEQTDDLVKLVESLPKGLFAVLCNENARYTAFSSAMTSLILPQGSRISWHTGCYVVDSSNRAVMGLNTDEDWVCFMGDDHVFSPFFMLQLLGAMYKDDLDIIVPTCFRRSFPPVPVIYTWAEDAAERKEQGGRKAWYPLDMDEYPDGGVVEVDAAGSAGMIVRQRVFKKMIDEDMIPFFELGVGQWGEDLHFCWKAKELGFKIHAHLDVPLGHLVNTALWPVRNEKTGEWACQYDFNTQGGMTLALKSESLKKVE
jgi:hypothetical protein